MQIEKIQQFKQMCSNISVLMVDDEIHLTDNYKEIAERFFHKVEIANSAQEAIASFEVNKYDIIFTDLNMPIMDGLKLVKRIRTDAVHKDVPIMIITTEGAAEDRQRALQLGANEYVTKPIQAPQVISKVKELLKIQ